MVKDKVKEKVKELPKEVTDTAHKVWLAGLGAMVMAEEEGSKFFKSLVKKGEEYEGKGKVQFDKLRDRLATATGKAGKAWTEVSDKVDEQVAAAMARLGVPTKDEIATLTARVEELTELVEKARHPKTAKTTARS